MDDIDRVVRDALTDWPDDDNFFVEWHRFIHGRLAPANWLQSKPNQRALGIRRRRHR
ncbi:hypothetical protein [Novosphingobium sp. JCM 18896]|uniref:hypothetical protein n=1 Tax=Novosphingobium sp. JCM 18896 TaxID=2989731 RepID=UPI0022234ECA|nr:hypothetical protein [Novosphingobium sp. JCM 18896]MCW1432198.1 hypothetical protein [Novosphingobium sp. JCM 18896]